MRTEKEIRKFTNRHEQIGIRGQWQCWNTSVGKFLFFMRREITPFVVATVKIFTLHTLMTLTSDSRWFFKQEIDIIIICIWEVRRM